ncbi:hypothetical protein [Vibrio maerlii]|uniref:hypothetical protein n=1 Tax=Vibrio maerlii TaxID=2231648 RepID=UPI000E3C3AF8|nr:hypothetical protein [Vibrio maerlii]
MNNEKIDFIVTWVDQTDSSWKEDFLRHKSNIQGLANNNDSRYRDWDQLKYWFRGVAKYASWVNKIHFVTYGHVPSWLNIKHPKINVVKHSDYIDENYLPTFNSRVIELHFPKIASLSEKFVYFNDDFFIVNDVDKIDFFKNGKPLDYLVCNAEFGSEESPTNMNNLSLLNKLVNKRDKKLNELFNYKYCKYNIRNLLLLPWKQWTGFYESHLPQSYLKSVISDVYNKCDSSIRFTSESKFRSKENVSHYLFRYYQLVTNNFIPKNPDDLGVFYNLSPDDIENIKLSFKSEKVIVLNDNDSISSIEYLSMKEELERIFIEKFPFKSEFEN